MKLLITSSRMPFALDEIRKLGQAGHDVHAADTFRAAPGNHSRHARAYHLVHAPRFDPSRFRDDVRSIITRQEIDLVIPAFEEVFYLADHDLGAPVFAPSLSTLQTLHDKSQFQRLAQNIGLDVPETTLVSHPSDLSAALRVYPRYLARAAYSRGGVQLLTNSGPLAGLFRSEDADPTLANPWLVQRYVDGQDVCSFSVVHGGKVAAHATYVHPRRIEHAGGIVFESVSSAATLPIVQAIAEATKYTGQLSLDFKRSARGLVVIECNPRPTAGVMIMPGDMFEEALFRPRENPQVAPSGTRGKFGLALLRNMVRHKRGALIDAHHLFSDATELCLTADDPMPGIWQLASYFKVKDYQRHVGRTRTHRTDVIAAYFYDILYDGPVVPRSLPVPSAA